MNGCETMKCTDYRDGVCHYDSDVCKYRDEVSVDSNSLLSGKEKNLLKTMIALYEREHMSRHRIYSEEDMVKSIKEKLLAD